MASGVHAVGGGLARLKRQLNAAKLVPQKAVPQLAGETLSLIDDGFAKEAAPGGAPWKPSNGFGDQTQTVTGGLRDSFHAEKKSGGFTIVSDSPVFWQRQKGGTITAKGGGFLRFQVPVSARIASVKAGAWSRMARRSRSSFDTEWVQVRSVTQPARPMVPGSDMPAPWRERFLRVCRDTFDAALKL